VYALLEWWPLFTVYRCDKYLYKESAIGNRHSPRNWMCNMIFPIRLSNSKLLQFPCNLLNAIYSALQFHIQLKHNPYKFPTEISQYMFFYSYVLCFLLDVLQMDHQTDAFFGDLIQRSVVRIISAVWFAIEGLMKNGWFYFIK
jgi:hypothetical protein